MKNKTFFQSVKYAVIGMVTAYKTEKNLKIYTAIATVGFILNIIFKIDTIWWLGYIITTIGVFASEYINTSIENLANTITTEIKPEIKIVKDVAASAVLTWGIGYFTVEIIAILGKIL